MSDERDQDLLAAEYVLGTLDAEEREQARARLHRDPEFAALVGQWERRLGDLSAMVEPIEPLPHAWNRIRARIAGSEPSGEIRLPDVPESRPAVAAASPAADGARILTLSRRVSRWRGATAAVGALAAALLLFVALQQFVPERLPPALRSPVQVVEKPVEVVRTVEVAARPPARFVAVLQKDASAPAFLLSVDVETRTFTMRRVAAEQEPGRSYELWLVSDRFPAPRSLGVVGNDEFTQRAALASYDAETINAATYAVSIEPEGGSPTGAPTGPVAFVGKLVEAVPPAATR